MTGMTKSIQDEILAGLPNERDRLDDARQSGDFYRGRMDAYSPRPVSGNWEGPRYTRYSRIMTWLVDTLAAHLYESGPTRTLADQPEASEWLNKVYQDNTIDATMQGADRWATVSEVAAVQVVPNEDPDRPVRHVLWPGHQLCVWESEDDPLTPEAVGVIDLWDNQRRLRLWTAEAQYEYRTDKLGPGQTSGGTAYRIACAPTANPFGIIPFSFVHYNYPDTQFWSGSPGKAFRDLNDYVNGSLTEVGDSIRYCAKPVILANGVREGWRPNLPIVPGAFWDLPSEGVDAAGNGIPPDVRPLQFDLGFVDVHWADIQSYIDHCMMCADVPPAAFRMIQDSAKSGASIVAEQLPLIRRAKARQRAFGCYERDLARVTLAVGGAHLAGNGVSGSEALLAAAADPALSLRWPEIGGRVIDPQRDQEDSWRLDNGLASRTQILQERWNFTREEAEAYLVRVAEDRKREDVLLGLTEPSPSPPTPNQIGVNDDV